MASAADFPAAMASMTLLGPVTTSPPAKTPGRVVAMVAGSTMIVPHFGDRVRPSLSLR